MSIPPPFDPQYVEFIRRIISVAETDDPVWKPDAVYLYNDGKDGRKQCTLSIGFTADGGNLRKVLERYVEDNGAYGTQLVPYIAALKEGEPGTDPSFITLLKEIGREDPLMMEVQEEMFDKLYLGPAFDWAARYGFGLPLSYLVIADSFLHSGSMLNFLMQKFSEPKPSSGGEEKIWIPDYLEARKQWLSQHSNKLLRNTVYRVNCYLEECSKDHWNLDTAVVMNGTTVNPVA
jgi:chitosanase